jgi:hypothetical protein
VRDRWYDDLAPSEDGIFRVELDTGKTTLIISHDDMAGFPAVQESPKGFKRYFTHLLFNEDGSRFMFWYRGASGKGGWPSCRSSMYTASRKGKDICLLNDNNSHCTWWGRDKVLAWATHRDKGMHTFLFTDRTGDFRIVGEGLLEFNGHSTPSPDAKWLLTDIPPDARSERGLALYHFAANRRVDIGRFHPMPALKGELRCDLHPRWNRAGTRVCIDSTHEGSRQMYLFDVGGIVHDPDLARP